MGLLTDPGVERSKYPALFHSHHRLLGISSYCIGFIWFLALAHNSLNHGTYFSENALLPGLVQGEFMSGTQANNYLQSLKNEAEKHPSGVPFAWLEAQFTQLGLDTHTHNFTLTYPMDPKKVFEGKNVYSILRAVRGSSTEAIVVSAPYRPPTSLHQGTSTSIALLLALAQFFSEQVYWAKDIIFLVTEHEQLGAQAWLEAYHQSRCGSGALDSGDLVARGGPIQAAINLEIAGPRVSHIDVKIEGLNGQLPNLDLVNLIYRLCHRENVQHTFKNLDDHPNPESFEGWLHQLKTLTSMILVQASGIPNGNHGLYHRFGIASVTIEGIREDGRARRSASLFQLGRVMEGICRSLNNLLERFHQSFFFYLLPASSRYISIGVYMPPFGFLGGSLLIFSLALWYDTSCRDAKQKKLIDESKVSKARRLKNTQMIVDYSIIGTLPMLVLVHVLGLCASYCPLALSKVGAALGQSVEDSICYGLGGFVVAAIFIPVFFTRVSSTLNLSWEVLKCILVLEFAVSLFACAVYNFSLALIVCAIYAPVAMAAAPSISRLKTCIRCIFMILVHPCVIVLIFVSIDTYINFPDVGPQIFVLKALTATKRALVYAIVDSHIYGNWVFDIGCNCLFPVWMVLWTIVLYPIKSTGKSNKLKAS